MRTGRRISWVALAIGLGSAGILLLALSGLLRPAVGQLFSPFVSAQGWLYTRFSALGDLINHPADNAALRQQNSQLEQQVGQLQGQVLQLQQQLQDQQVLSSLLDFTRANPEYRLTGALVIGIDPNPLSRYVIIDQGTDNGLLYGMPVVSSQGLVGRVEAVIPRAARVQLITDPNSAVNVRLKDSQVDAVVRGSVNGQLTAEMIPVSAQVKPQELVLTSSLGGNYPAGLLVGQVSSVQRDANGLFQTALIQPAVDFRALKAILVITNFKPTDFSQLLPTPAP